jgi:outer membrane protein assembly factor BamB
MKPSLIRIAHPVLIIAAVAVLAVVCPAQTDSVEGSWPMYVESGDRTPPVKGLKLVEDINAIRQVWKFERHMSVGKGLYSGTLRRIGKMGIEPFQGGATSPIIAEGLVFCSYYKPDGGKPAKPKGWRTVPEPEKVLPPWFFSVTADDVLVAVDAETGKLCWERVEKGKGLNRLSHKRSHWGVSPAYKDGNVYHLGSMGILYATRARDGKELWETRTDPHLEKVRAEHIKAKKLCWDNGDRSSLIVAEDVVVVSRGHMHAYDVRTGQKRWSTGEKVIGQYATPTLWRHDGKEYILANEGRGPVRLIDPADGKILWTEKDLGPFLGTMAVTGDLIILNAGSRKSSNDDHGLFGVYRISLDGLEQLWTLPDEPAYWHRWVPDSGPRQKVCIRDGLAYIPIWLKRSPKNGFPRQRLIVADAKSGRVHTESGWKSGRSSGRPILLEDRILMIHDDAHGDPVNASWWLAGKNAKQISPAMGFPHVAISAYCTPIVQPYADGRMIFRSVDGLVCYDLRRPDPKTTKTIKLTIPDKLTGPRGDIHLSLYARDQSVDRGGIKGAGLMHAADVSKLKWNGETLTGQLGVDLPRTRKTVYFDLDAKNTGGKLTGTARLGEKALKKPVARAGAVHSMKHQPAWQPPCDHVLWLEEAALNKDRKPGRLLLFVSLKDDGSIARVAAWADRTTKTRPAVYPGDDLQIKHGKLVGSLVVRYRADQWTRPLTAEGYTAAAKYTIEAVPSKGDQKNIGSYRGTYGIAWSRKAPIKGTVE